MATREGKTRITITLGDGVLEKLDAYCEQSGLSRSAVIGDIVGSQLGAFEKITQSVSEELVSALLRAGFGGVGGDSNSVL